MPQRIQRKRSKGWKMPEGAHYVGRGTVWGNPFVVGKPCGVFPAEMGSRGEAETLIPALTLEQSLELYRDLLDGFIRPEMYPAGHAWRERMGKYCCGHPADIARLLRGNDLACWCPLDQPCHADILLTLANRP